MRLFTQPDSSPSSTGHRSSRYFQVGIERELSGLAGAPKGDRANATFRAAIAIGRIVGAGVIGFEEAFQTLLAAACSTGISHREAEGHVRNGLRRGMERPAELPTGGPARFSLPTNQPARPQPALVPPPRPGSTDLATLWDAAVAVTEDDEVASWCTLRGFDPAAIDDWDLARAIPRDTTLPRWAYTNKGGTWVQSSHRLLVPLYDASGNLASFRARAVIGDGQLSKSLAPTGFRCEGLVFACPLARQFLAGAAPTWWDKNAFVISEGEVDFLTWAIRYHYERYQRVPACLGVVSGSWSQSIADRIPDGATVNVRTHADAAGMRYAVDISQTLVNRCTVKTHPIMEAV